VKEDSLKEKHGKPEEKHLRGKGGQSRGERNSQRGRKGLVMKRKLSGGRPKEEGSGSKAGDW